MSRSDPHETVNFLWSKGVYCKQGFYRFFGHHPSSTERVILALLRLSRGKYLSANSVEDSARRLAKCLRGQYWFLTKKVFEDDDLYRANAVGLMCGVVPFQDGGDGFRELLNLQGKRKGKEPIELKILNLTLKGMKNGC